MKKLLKYMAYGGAVSVLFWFSAGSAPILSAATIFLLMIW